MFHRMGHPSRVFASGSCTLGTTPVEDLKSYHPNVRDVLLVHHSLGWAAFPQAFAACSRKVLVHHQVTPRRSLAGLDPALQRGAESARADLVHNNAKVRAAVAHSEFGAREL